MRGVAGGKCLVLQRTTTAVGNFVATVLATVLSNLRIRGTFISKSAKNAKENYRSLYWTGKSTQISTLYITNINK